MNTLDELVALGNDHGCLTGDCHHGALNDCYIALSVHIGEWVKAGKIAQQQLVEARGLLRELKAHEEAHFGPWTCGMKQRVDDAVR